MDKSCQSFRIGCGRVTEEFGAAQKAALQLCGYVIEEFLNVYALSLLSIV
ncbi:hypothetical protein SAMN05443507_101213 [Alicyclobacillus tolerans]|uniref:Uncharacterized protein n=1 Tax=Alicyclobacillus tolerans TaxID=90970 RepID=A0A1M6KCT7_9BACL|nr:hypothetical protein SAMN05443507_101213 [Alicyclobacillus montanus]